MTNSIDIDPAAVEQFGERVLLCVNEASIALLLSIGHQTGLLDTMAGLPPATSAQIADAADLDERYVREWLDKSLPWASFLYTISTMHCMTVSLALGGDCLGTVWGEETALRMLSDAGFADVQVTDVETDPFNTYYVARKAD